MNFLYQFKYNIYTVHAKNHTYGSRFVWFVTGRFTHILQEHITGTEAIIRLPQCQRGNPEEYGYIHHVKTTIKSQLKSKHNHVLILWDILPDGKHHKIDIDWTWVRHFRVESMSNRCQFKCLSFLYYAVWPRQVSSAGIWWIASFRRIEAWGPFYPYGLHLIIAWTSNNMPSKVWDEIIYPFINYVYRRIESIKTTSMEDVSTRVLEK